MKIEFLPDGSPDCPLIRIYGTSCDEFRELFTRMQEIAEGTRDRLDIHAITWFQPIRGTSLTLTIAANESLHGHASKFEWKLSRDRCSELASLIEPFTGPGASGFQWLCGGRSPYPSPSNVAVLISCSADGSW